MPKQIRDLSCSVSSFKYQLDKYLSTIPDTPCIANYDNSLENSSHTNPHLLTGVTYLLLVTSGCLAVVYSAWSAIAALHLSVIVFSLDLELRLLHSFGTIGESSIEHR